MIQNQNWQAICNSIIIRRTKQNAPLTNNNIEKVKIYAAMKNVIAFFAFFAFALSLNAQAPSFESFAGQFKKAALPFSICQEDMQSRNKAERLSWEYYQFLPELERSAQFHNMPVHPEPVAVLETENNYAFVCNLARGLGKNKSYCVVVYDRFGNYIATNFVAGSTATTLTTVTIDTELMAHVEQLDRATMLQGSQVIDLTAPGNPDQLDWSGIEMNGTASNVATK